LELHFFRFLWRPSNTVRSNPLYKWYIIISVENTAYCCQKLDRSCQIHRSEIQTAKA
jgi:hypothetical protein